MDSHRLLPIVSSIIGISGVPSVQQMPTLRCLWLGEVVPVLLGYVTVLTV